MEIAESDLNPPVVEEPVVPEVAEEPDVVVEDAAVPAEGDANVVIAATTVIGSGGASFHFMQESELEAEQTSFENDAEFIDKEEAQEAETAAEAAPHFIVEQTELKVVTTEVIVRLCTVIIPL